MGEFSLANGCDASTIRNTFLPLRVIYHGFREVYTAGPAPAAQPRRPLFGGSLVDVERAWIALQEVVGSSPTSSIRLMSN